MPHYPRSLKGGTRMMKTSSIRNLYIPTKHEIWFVRAPNITKYEKGGIKI